MISKSRLLLCRFHQRCEQSSASWKAATLVLLFATIIHRLVQIHQQTQSWCFQERKENSAVSALQHRTKYAPNLHISASFIMSAIQNPRVIGWCACHIIPVCNLSNFKLHCKTEPQIKCLPNKLKGSAQANHYKSHWNYQFYELVCFHYNWQDLSIYIVENKLPDKMSSDLVFGSQYLLMIPPVQTPPPSITLKKIAEIAFALQVRKEYTNVTSIP